jgi:hypothetical protein
LNHDESTAMRMPPFARSASLFRSSSVVRSSTRYSRASVFGSAMYASRAP